MRKIILSLVCLLGSFVLLQAQTFQNSEASSEGSVTVENLLERLDAIGTVPGSVGDYFTPYEQRMLYVHYNGIQNMAPQVITQSNSQVIEAGAGIACATHPIAFRDNNFYRDFDLAGQFGITNGFEVNAVEFAIDAIDTPSSFPITVNIYSATPNTFPNGTLTLQGTEVYNASNADAMSIVNVPISATIPAGESMVMELVLVDDGTETHYMTMGVNSAGETGPSYIKAEECGANSPMTFGSLGLGVGLIWNVLGDDEIGGGTAGEIYGINNSTENLITFDMNDPDAFTVVGPSSAVDFENAGSIDPNNNGTAYALDNAGSFFEIDLATGNYTLLGNIAAPGAETWAGAEFHPVSGELYAISTDINQSTLSLIDIDGVSRTTIGATGIEGAISLMIDDAGQGYAHDIVSDQFFQVDLTTGASTVVGSLGFDANFGQGGCWIAEDPGYVYLSAFNSGSFSSEWRRLDISTGSSTIVGLFSGGSDQVAWSSPVQDGVVKVADNKLEGFTFYPNPTTEIITLQSVNNIESVALYNILGQRVLITQVGATTKELDLSALPAGPYVMKVSVDGQVGSYKILKK